MSRINDVATVDLFVNGEKAEAQMDRLRKKADDLAQAIVNANSAGDSKEAKKLESQLKKTQKELARVESTAKGTGVVLNNLSNTSIHGLKNALKHLEKQIQLTKPDSEAWHQYKEEIDKVKSRLSELNNELSKSPSLWDRVSAFANKVWPVVDLASKGFDSIVSGLRSYVNAFAEMDQEMANVRKFTGMTADQVESLNEELKKIDTRTPREELNKLAQEAGRLGKSSEEDVLGFVRAADKISVALDDLGSDATLQLSKLTGIFGDEARYGTEQSLLKVGSVINELSQNCSASAPYLAEFASRMGGVGAQAGMSVQQIMGFAAVLDSNNQKVESSATALSQVITRLYKDPAKYAKVAGLDVKMFTDLLKNDANAAVLTLLETLNKVGGMDKLSPMFADMGETGARAISALATLATHIDDVKSQQKAANAAFAEGTSIDQEFAVQNNTVQASLEKCKNRANELRVELGARLAPILGHLLTTGAAIMRLLIAVINYISQNKVALTALAVAWGAYALAVNKATIALKAHAAVDAISIASKKALRGGLLLARAAFNAVTGNITRASAAMKLFNMTTKMSPWGLLLSGISAAVTLFTVFSQKAKESSQAQTELSETIHDTNSQLVSEQKEIDRLFSALRKAKEGSKEYEEAKGKIIDQYGQYLSGLIDEKNNLIDVEQAYLRVSAAARDSLIARGMADAKKKADDKFVKADAKAMAEVEKELKKYLKNQADLAPIMQLIRADLSEYHTITYDTEKIIKAAIKKGKKSSSIADIEAAIDKAGKNYDTHEKRIKNIETKFGYSQNEFVGYTKDQLEAMAQDLRDQLADKSATSYEIVVGGQTMSEGMSKAQAAAALNRIEEAIKTNSASSSESKTNDSSNGSSSYVSEKATKQADRERKQAEQKAKAALKEDLKDEKKLYEQALTDELARFNAKEISYSEYLERKLALDLDFNAKQKQVLEEHHMQDTEEYSRVCMEQESIKMKSLENIKKYKFKELEAEHTRESTQAEASYYAGLIDYGEYLEKIETLDNKLVDDKMKLLESANQTESSDYAELLRQKEALTKKHLDRVAKLTAAANEAEHIRRTREIELEFTDPTSLIFGNEKARYQANLIEQHRYLTEMRDMYLRGSDEWLRYQSQIDELIANDKVKKQQELAEALMQYSAEYRRRDRAQRQADEIAILDELHSKGLLSEKEYQEGLSQIRKKYRDKARNEEKDKWDESRDDVQKFNSDIANQMYSLSEALDNLFDSSEGEDFWKNIATAAEASFAIMSSLSSQFTSYYSASKDLEIAKVTKSYDKQIAAAGKNSKRAQQLEEEKQKKIAKLKSKYNTRAMKIEIAMALAETAKNAIAAYGAGLKFPYPANVVMPAVLAGLAIAQGALQIATIKKQHEAQAEGYSSGGFTKPGRVDEPAGIVHAGEWVASQKLLANPVARPLINALDYAQRTNTIGSLRAEDVSRSITANNSLVRIAESDNGTMAMVAVASRMSGAVTDLTDRLREPFVTVNTVTGDRGIQAAQDEYARLIANKTPKSKRHGSNY